MLWLVVGIAIYLLSFILTYSWIRAAYSEYIDPRKDGRWSHLNAGAINLFFTFMPFINTVVAFSWLFYPPCRIRGGHRGASLNKFFLIKKV